MVLSLCLFACKDNGDETGGQIASAQLGSSSTSITITDVKDESAAKAQFTAAANGIQVRLLYSGGAAPVQVTGAQCDIDMSGITWGKVGVYSATVTPKTQGNVVNDSKVQTSEPLEVRIEHDFGEAPANGSAQCKNCTAVQTSVALEEGKYETVYVDGFHAGTKFDTSKGDISFVKEFGTTALGSVPTATAGTIRKGASITLEGTVQTREASAANSWYYPNLGIALRNFDSSTSSVNPTDGYEGGLGIIVRNDGWVLMDGIGDNRQLAGLVGGPNANFNYGSHTGAANTSVPFEGYDPKNPPADVSAWADWSVYSSGTLSYTEAYEKAQTVRFTYSFRDDNVIEIINENLTANTTFTARIKVPEAYANASFDTVIHGEYISMSFNKFVLTEAEKLEDIRFNGLGDDAKVNYVANEVVNFADFDGTIEIKFQGNDTWRAPDSYELQVFRGTVEEGKEPAEDAKEWTTIEEDTRLLASDTYFRIAVTVGSTTCYDTAKLGDDGFFKKITPNNIDEVYGYVGELQGFVLDSTAFGNVGFAANEEASRVVIKPVGVASAIDASAAAAFPFDGYIVLRVYGEGFTKPTDLGSVQDGYIILASEETFFDVVVGFNADAADKTYTITGLQATPIVIDLSEVTAPTYAGFVTSITVDGKAQDTIPVNTGADVTFTYTLKTASVKDAKFDITYSATPQYYFGIEAFTLEEGNKDKAFLNYPYTATLTDNKDGTSTFVITVEAPAAPVDGTDLGAFKGYFYADGRLTTQTVYYGAPIANEGNGQQISDDAGYSLYVEAVGTKLYYYVIFDSKETLTEADIKLADWMLNVNGGAAEDVSNINLGFSYKDGALVMKDTSGAIATKISVFGTTDDKFDYDHGFFFMGEVDVTKFGIETGAATWYFQVMQDVKADAEKNVYKVTTADGVTTIAANTDAVTKDHEVQKRSCESTGLTADVIKSGDDIVFIFNAVYTTSHIWEEVEGKHGVFKCGECGALYTDTAVNFATGALAGAKTKGLTVSFAYFTDMGDDWGKHTLKTSTNNLIIAGGTVDPWNVTTDGLEGELKTIAEGMQGTNLYPGKASGSQHNNSGVSPFVDTPSGYVTVVVDPDAKNGGIRFYINGQLKIGYTNTHESSDDKNKKMSVTNIVKFFLEIAEKNGVTVAAQNFNTANYAIVQVGVLDEKEIATRYNNYVLEEATYPTDHTWSTDKASANYDHCTEKDCGVLNPRHGTAEFPHAYVTDKASANYDKCIACGAVHPDHGKAGHEHVYKQGKCVTCGAIDPSHTTHTYVNGVCSVCEVVCEHKFDETTKVCSVCGGTYSEVKNTYGTTGNPELAKWGATTNVMIVGNNKVVLETTYKDAGAERWNGIVVQVKSAKGTLLYFIRPAGDYASYNDAGVLVWNTALADDTVTAPGFVSDTDAPAFTAAKKTAKTRVTVTLDMEKDTMTFVYELLDASGKATRTDTWTITGMTDSMYVLGFALDGATITDAGATISAQNVAYPAADAK